MLQEESPAELPAEPTGSRAPLPDVQAAEHREDDAHGQGQRYGKDQRQQLVEQVLAELEESVAAHPHFVEGVG